MNWLNDWLIGWLLYVQGGFVSTQDTVVALQALSVYGTEVNKYKTNMKVQVSNLGI